jgi:hypothetical protein
MSKTVGSTVVFESEEAKAEAFKARKNEAAKRMLARKAEAMNKLIALALKVGTAEEKAAAAYLQPHPVGPRGPNPVEAIREAGSMHEDDIFKTFRLGRAEMKKFLKANEDMVFEDGYYSIG